jgi:hypothetical protein
VPRKADSTDSTDGLPERGKPQTGPVEAGIMQTGRVVKASGLVLLMVLSTVAAPASAQEVVQDPKQPSPDNPHMHIYGNDDLSNCFAHFDGNDTTGSSNQGYGEEVWTSQNSQIEMDYTCKMEESFKQDMYLDDNGTIEILLIFQIYADENGCGGSAVCENLNLTLFKGTFELARQEFPNVPLNGNDYTVNWQIPIDKNMTRFNRTEEPQIRVEFSYPGYNSIIPVIGYNGGEFRMYYHDPGNDTAEVEFPVVNQTLPGGGGEGEGIGGAISDAVPGFGLIAGIGALALAAVGASRFSREE